MPIGADIDHHRWLDAHLFGNFIEGQAKIFGEDDLAVLYLFFSLLIEVDIHDNH
jgi:hypothetical protein